MKNIIILLLSVVILNIGSVSAYQESVVHNHDIEYSIGLDAKMQISKNLFLKFEK